MRTYSKRHRTATVLRDVADDDWQTAQKRVHPESDTDRRSRKRERFGDRQEMTGTFETPHPTLEASSQVYKLPSTKPIPSPTPFSPVPPVPITSDLRTRSSFATTSKGLKENAGSRRSIRSRQSYKTLSSFTVASGSGPPSHNTRGNGEQTRPSSRSSNSASSSSRSRDLTKLSKAKSKLIKKSKFKTNATVNKDLFERHSSNSAKSIISQSKLFTKGNELNVERNLLASPFASRAPSPTDISNSGIANSGLHGSMDPPAVMELVSHSGSLPKVYADPSVSSSSRTRKKTFQSRMARITQVCDASGVPEKPVLPNQVPGRDVSWKNRRPSAPSNLQRPPKPVGKAHIPAKRAKQPGYKQFKDDNKDNLHTNELRFRKPALLHLADPVNDCELSVESIATPDPFSWMQERTAVDFNRPPSQVSLHPPSDLNYGEDGADADGVFWSSGEDNDDDIVHLDQRLGANLGITSFPQFTSTPNQKFIARRPNVQILKGSSIALADRGNARSMPVSPSSKVGVSFGEGENMELTAPLQRGDGETCHDSIFFQEHTPWITDSIISPPTTYTEREKQPVVIAEEKGVDRDMEKEQQLTAAGSGQSTSPSPSGRKQIGILSSPFKSSCTKEDHAVANGAENEGTSIVQLHGPPQRTPRGTILVARNGVGTARRTRTGTIVGPAATGRTRSGTIVARVKVPEPTVSGNRRIRSGSIVGPVTDPTGSITKLEPSIVGAEDVHESIDGELTRIENKGSGSIEEVNEAECYVDSLYLTSPDPIDFLTGAKVEGDESELVVAIEAWQVADEPPSPEIRKAKKTLQTPRVVGRPSNRRLKLKGNRKNRARFLGADGQVESYECNDASLNFEDRLNSSDDELLLVEGQSRTLFG